MRVTAQEHYERLKLIREPFLRRAQENSRITIPALFPESDGLGGDLPDPYQSVGARGVNAVAAELLNSLFPVHDKFVRHEIEAGSDLLGQGREKEAAEQREALDGLDWAIVGEFEVLNMRAMLYEMFLHCVVGGNALPHVPVAANPRLYRLHEYVVERTPRDDIRRIVIHQKVDPMTLPPKQQRRVMSAYATKFGAGVTSSLNPKCVDVYTMAERQPDGSWIEAPEVNGVRLESTTHPTDDDLPYLPQRMRLTPGESYGRAYVDDYLGDLKALEALRYSLVAGSLQAAKVVWIRNPDGEVLESDYTNAPNGGVIDGMPDDLTAVRLDKAHDFAVARQEVESLKRDLGIAFGLNATLPRNAERVTGEEIRFIAQEVERSRGGAYSLFASTLQGPLGARLRARLEQRGFMEEIHEDVSPVAVAGLAALGRGAEFERVVEFANAIKIAIGEEALSVLNLPVVVRALAAAQGIDAEFVKSDEQLGAEVEQGRAAGLIEQFGPELMKQNPDAVAQVAQQFFPQAQAG